eukprot:CAMPEP_0172690548 /NCGR_PEP_ID=MMETSP1074-20121228/23944_1 /TAXON_ID=2916 /ORGANISM="Ceratium fusus, Strain PA161109" /LENGTH=62 /DNA_ID=CAMNT_0013510513 /DNA_START=63 /DNA_END=250 /DNA_ORIENTATION=+
MTTSLAVVGMSRSCSSRIAAMVFAELLVNRLPPASCSDVQQVLHETPNPHIENGLPVRAPLA